MYLNMYKWLLKRSVKVGYTRYGSAVPLSHFKYWWTMRWVDTKDKTKQVFLCGNARKCDHKS